MRVKLVSARLLTIGLIATGTAVLPIAATAANATACEALGGIAVEHTTIHSAETVPAEGFEPPPPSVPGPVPDYSGLPEFCRVTGSIAPTPDSDIRFELWLPAANWNGKFLQTGNGGAAGTIIHGSLAEPLARGYAVANTDTGHQGGVGDFTWVPGHPEKLVDYQHRAVHELTRVGKAITAARFGRAPGKSYWLGCSTGGRQGLKEAQMYPEDYDGIIAGAPANNLMALMSMTARIEAELAASGLDLRKLTLVQNAALAACDAGDGVADRVISHPENCRFDPVTLACAGEAGEDCLDEAELAAVQSLSAGLVDAAGRELFPGSGPASEPEWAAYAMPEFGIGKSYYRHVVFGDPEWDPADLDLGSDLPRAEAQDGGAGVATDPDLSAFVANGGKLILYHGTTDGMIPYRNTVNYYESVVDRLGPETVESGVRLYLVPGMNHCGGGEGAFAVDWLSALEAWVEEGVAPGSLAAARPDRVPAYFGGEPRPTQPFTRPVCSYPEVVTYGGSGDTADAASFHCEAP